MVLTHVCRKCAVCRKCDGVDFCEEMRHIRVGDVIEH